MTISKLVRRIESDQFYIKVQYDKENEKDLWHGIVEHCAKALTINELKKVYDDCNKQLKKLDKNDTPLLFIELMNELSQTIINRGVYKK